jgi:hypothetical protein
MAFTATGLLLCANTTAEETLTQKEFEQSVTLSVTTEKPSFIIGEPILFSVKLCATREITVDTLETASGSYGIASIDRRGERHAIGAGTMGNDYFINEPENSKEKSKDYEFFRQMIIVDNDKIKLSPGQCIEKGYEALSLMKIRVGPCNCVIGIKYSYGWLSVRTEAKFKVVVDYPKTIPYFLDLLETGDADAKTWARATLWALTDDEMPTWNPSDPIRPDKDEIDINELRKWWEEHKDEERFKNRTHEDILKLW